MPRLRALLALAPLLLASPVTAQTIDFSNLTSGASASAGSHTTASITPTPGATGYCAIFTRGDGDLATPTPTGVWATWTCPAGLRITNGSDRTLQICVGTGAITPGTVGISYAPSTNVHASAGATWIIDQAVNTAASPMVGSGCAANGAGTTGTCTLAAFADAVNNGAYAAHFNAGTITEEAGWAELDEQTSPNGAFLATEWRIGQDTSPSSTDSNDNWYFAALEVAFQAPSGGGPRLLLTTGVGR